MPHRRFSGSLTAPKVDLFLDLGNPFLNLTVDSFLKIGTVAVGKAAAEEAYHVAKRELYLNMKRVYRESMSVSHFKNTGRNNLDPMGRLHRPKMTRKCATILQLKKMCKEGAYWGTVAGVYVGMEYGMERIRGTRDWVPSLLATESSTSDFLNQDAIHTRIHLSTILWLTFSILAPTGSHDLMAKKNAMIGGALTGAIVSAASSKSGDKIVMDAIAGGAVATAAEFINYLT
ncbi:hypothetical protein Leryth_009579 [Lithospermum erythrorhizon]|nr:hypothetical protein Leryth_009579 [Lithospermum erythrorhizon]